MPLPTYTAVPLILHARIDAGGLRSMPPHVAMAAGRTMMRLLNAPPALTPAQKEMLANLPPHTRAELAAHPTMQVVRLSAALLAVENREELKRKQESQKGMLTPSRRD